MLSKSTKRKHRLLRANKPWFRVLQNVSLYSVDPRCDFWLVSIPHNLAISRCLHVEIFGADNARRFYAKVMGTLRCPSVAAEAMRTVRFGDQALNFTILGY